MNFMLFTNNMKEVDMLKLATVPAEAYQSIHKFQTELEASPELQARLSYARAWYAHKDEAGRWRFAPSKFAGYKDIDAKSYLEGAEISDGRRTETQLQQYFRPLEPTNPLFQELNAALFSLLAEYGKTPSAKIRINVVRDRRLLGPVSSGKAHDPIIDLIVAVAQRLPPVEFRRLLDQLEDVAA
jgi:hypothetical protein